MVLGLIVPVFAVLLILTALVTGGKKAFKDFQ